MHAGLIENATTQGFILGNTLRWHGVAEPDDADKSAESVQTDNPITHQLLR